MLRKLIVVVSISLMGLLIYSTKDEVPARASKTHDVGSIATAKQDRPDEAQSYWASLTRAPKGKNPAMLKQAMVQSLKTDELNRRKNHAADDRVPLAFTDIGSGTFGGRIRGMALHPDDANIAVAGGVSGGFFKTTDRGQNWRAIDDFLPTLAISSIIVDPDDNERLFAGTGEGFFNADAQFGAGIFVSEDFGESWTQLPATVNSNFVLVNRLARVASSDVLLAATGSGIFRSTNLGQSWTEVSQVETTGRGFVDIKADPANNQRLLAVHFADSESRQPALVVNSPTVVAGEYLATTANFGPSVGDSPLSADLVLAEDNVGTTTDGCESILTAFDDEIAVIDRGSCFFVTKVKNAQDAGAIGVLIVNNVPGDPVGMGGDDDTITIPSLMISMSDGAAIKNAIGSSTVDASFRLSDTVINFVMSSDDGGANWTMLGESDGLPIDNVSRMEIGFGSDSVVYIAASDSEFETRGLFRSEGVGSDFVEVSVFPFIERQGWFDLAVAVDPFNSDIVYAGAVEMFKSTNGGTTMSKTTVQFPGGGGLGSRKYVHADHHNYQFAADGSLWVATDGGVFRSANGGGSFELLNNGLRIAQPYSIAVHPQNGRVTAGNQDNGSQLYFGDNEYWLPWVGSDGMFTLWDQDQSQYVYTEIQNGQVFGSSNGGLSVSSMAPLDSDSSKFVTPLAIDPNDGRRILAGPENIFLTTNARSLSAAQWTEIADDSSRSIQTLSFDPHNSEVAWAGTAAGRVLKIESLGNQNILTDFSGILFNSPVTSIEIDLSDQSSQTMYLTLAGYATDRVFRSGNGGLSWQSIHGNLPDLPVFRIRVDPIDANRLWLGTELGLWTGLLNSGSVSWQRYDYGPAYTRVVEIIWRDEQNIYVGTHGRGTFRGVRDALEISLGPIAETAGCDGDSILDLGEQGTLPINIRNLTGQQLDDVSVSVQSDFTGLDLGVFILTVQDLLPGATMQVTRALSLDNSGSCLASADLDITVNYAGGSQSANLALPLAADPQTNNGNFFDGAEDDEPLMVSDRRLNNAVWTPATSQARSGSSSWFVANATLFSDSTLTSPWLMVNSANSELSFSLYYDTEGSATQYWDGAVLEVRSESDGDNWSDLGQFSSIPYDGQLATNNTARVRFAWSGSRRSWRDAIVDLGSRYLGETIQFRFRMVADTNAAEEGFWVDDIQVTGIRREAPMICDMQQCDAMPAPKLGIHYDRTRTGHGFELQHQGDNYFILLYTYGADNTSEWVLGVGTMQDGVVTIPDGDFHKFEYDFDNSSVILPTPGSGGNASLDFNIDATEPACAGDRTGAISLARFDWALDGETGSWCTEYLVVGGADPVDNPSGSWYAGPDDSGWGMTIVVQGDVLVVVIYFYDANGKSRWAIGNISGWTPGLALTIPMSTATGFCRSCETGELVGTDAGSLTLTLSEATQLQNTDNKATVDVSYTPISGSTWQRDDVEIRLISDPLGQ